MLPESSSSANLTENVSVKSISMIEIPLTPMASTRSTSRNRTLTTITEPPIHIHDQQQQRPNGQSKKVSHDKAFNNNDNDKISTISKNVIDVPESCRQDGSVRKAITNALAKDERRPPLSNPSRHNYLHILFRTIRKYFSLTLFVLYNVYLIVACCRTWKKTKSFGEGIKLLIVVTSIAYLFLAYYLVLKKHVVKPIYYNWIVPILNVIDSDKFLERHLSKIIWSVITSCVVVYTIIITGSDRYRLVSGCGIVGFIAFGYLMSEHRSRINWNQVLWGVFLQFSLALFVLRTEFGKQFFKCIGDKIESFLEFTDQGSGFLFGYLVTGVKNDGLELPGVFAFQILPVILFFSFFVSILYYYGVMQAVVIKVGWCLQVTIGTTPCESINAAANIFLGMTEAPLIIKPYLPIMTKSELFAIMTGGFATIAGAVMAAYLRFGVNSSHLLSASVMAAPGALGLSKLFYPETEQSKCNVENLSIARGSEQNALEAAGNGASQAIKICSNIAANLIAFIAFIKFLNSMFIWFGTNLDLPFDLSFEFILSILFVPIALLMGVEWSDSLKVAKLIGLKTFMNEFVAYEQLSNLMKTSEISDRSIAISTYALCGFSNFASMGIMLGALGSLAPDRKSDMAAIVFKAMIAGSTVTFLSASVAGLLLDETLMARTNATTEYSSIFINETTTISIAHMS